MYNVEIWGLIIAIAGLVVAVTTAFFPPRELTRKLIHAFYIAALFITSLLFAYLIFGSHAEIENLTAHIQEKSRLSTQAKALSALLNERDPCNGVILSVFAFFEKWKMEIPGAYEIAKLAANRAYEPSKSDIYERRLQVSDCQADANGMRRLLDGLAVQ